MLYQYAFRLETLKLDDISMKFRKIISKERSKKIDRFHFDADKVRSLYAEVVIRYGLSKQGITGESVSFEANQYGKPRLAGREDVFFNVSHSGDWVVCAVSDSPVGVDVEEAKHRALDIAERFYSPEEYEELLNCPEGKISERFCEYWTLKESYVKAVGKGLCISFTTFRFDLSEEPIQMYLEGELNQEFNYFVYPIEPGYRAAICTKDSTLGKFQILTLHNLIEELLVEERKFND